MPYCIRCRKEIENGMICLSCETLWEKLGRNLRALWTEIQAFWHEHQIAEQERKARREKMEAESFRESEPLYSSDLTSSRRYPAHEIILQLSRILGWLFLSLLWISLLVFGISSVLVIYYYLNKDLKVLPTLVTVASSLFSSLYLAFLALVAFWLGEQLKLQMDIEESTRQTRENTGRIVELFGKGGEETTKEA